MADRETDTVMVERLRAAAVARFGAERARALDEMIRLTASHLVAVDAYRLEADEPPAFLLDAATPPVAS
jgi:hypothetical protein